MSTSTQLAGLEVRAVADADELLSARKLHTSCYLAAGYAARDDLDRNGLIDDAWVPYSDYFVAVEDVELRGTCRLIRPSPRGLQTFQHSQLHPASEKFFAKLDANACVEVSSLATSRDGERNRVVAAALYGAVWREAVLRRHAYLVALMDPRLLRIMRRFFRFPFMAIGPSYNAFGGDVTPVAMYLPSVIEQYRVENEGFMVEHGRGLSRIDLEEFVIDLRANVPEHPAVA